MTVRSWWCAVEQKRAFASQQAARARLNEIMDDPKTAYVPTRVYDDVCPHCNG